MSIPISSIQLNFSAEEYVVAESVKLTFNVVYALNDPDKDAKQEVFENAEKLIPNAEWYITDSSRSTDRSGIEIAIYQMTVRVKESYLNGIQGRIDSVNRKGLKFELMHTDYSPSKSQLEEVEVKLRRKIYNKIKAELEYLNSRDGLKEDPNEEWQTGDVNFGNRQIDRNNKSMSLSTYANVSGPRGSSGDNEANSATTGLTQRVNMSADVSLVRKIYSRL